jgi:hypothetical protein
MAGSRLIRHNVPLRPTRQRLIIAMGVSACLVFLVLTSLSLVVKLASSTVDPDAVRDQVVAISIRHDDADPEPDPASDDRAANLPLQDDDPVPAVAVPPLKPPPDEPDPIISDLRFKPQIHVAGIGFAIGSCFIGIPIVGVPVEQRSVAITVFVCARDSG